jgi:hypothetical protein
MAKKRSKKSVEENLVNLVTENWRNDTLAEISFNEKMIEKINASFGERLSPGFKKFIRDHKIVVTFEYLSDMTKCYLMINDDCGDDEIFVGISKVNFIDGDHYSKEEGEDRAMDKALDKFIEHETNFLEWLCERKEKLMTEIVESAERNLEKKQKQIAKRIAKRTEALKNDISIVIEENSKTSFVND